MAKFTIKTVTWYGLLALFVLLGLLPILKGTMPAYFPSSIYQGFSDMECSGVVCDEGEFCASGKKCLPVATRYPNAVPTGNV
jgi:hypothetical protein